MASTSIDLVSDSEVEASQHRYVPYGGKGKHGSSVSLIPVKVEPGTSGKGKAQKSAPHVISLPYAADEHEPDMQNALELSLREHQEAPNHALLYNDSRILDVFAVF